MTGKTVHHAPRLMRATPLFIQPSHVWLTPQTRCGGHARAELMTGGTGTRIRRAKDKLTVGIALRSSGNLGKRPAMFRVAGRAGRSFRRQVTVPGHLGERRPILEIPFRMATHTAGRTGTSEGFVAVSAPGLIHMVAAQISRRPERNGTSDRSPADPDDEHKRDSGYHRHRSSWQRMVSHPSRKSREEQRTRHVQQGEHEKHERHRRVDCLPHAERFLFRSHSMQVRVDIAVG